MSTQAASGGSAADDRPRRSPSTPSSTSSARAAAAHRPRRRCGAARRESRRRPKRSRSETMARIAWALPWIAIAVTIVIVGGEVFAVAMIGFACVGLAELFRMTRDARPFGLAAYAAAAALVVAAFYGTQFQMMIVLAATVAVVFAAAARSSGPPGGHDRDRAHDPRRGLDRDPVRARGAAARASRSRRGPAGRRTGRDLRRRHRRLRGRAAVRAPPPGSGALAQQDARGTRRRASSAARWASGSPASTRTGCPGSTRC